MQAVGTLEVDFILNAANFMSGMKKAADQSVETANSIKESMDFAKEAVEGLLEAMAVDWFLEKIDSALEYAEAIKKVNEAIGISTKFVQEFGYASSQVGVSMQASNAALTDFAVALGKADEGNEKFLKRLTQLGVTSRDPHEALLQLADGVKKFDTSTADAAADAKKFLGDASFAPLLKEGVEGFNEAAEAADKLGVVLGQGVIGNSVEAAHKISALKMIISADWANVIGQNASAIAQLAQEFISAAGAALKFATNLEVARNMSMQQNNPFLVDIPKALYGYFVKGQNQAQMGAEAFDNDMGTHEGRQAQFDKIQGQIKKLNSGDTFGLNIADNPQAIADMKAQLIKSLDYIVAKEKMAGQSTDGATNLGHLPPPKAEKTHDRSPEQKLAFDKELASETSEMWNLKASLTSDPAWKANYQRDQINADYGHLGEDGKWDRTGAAKDQEIDDQLRAGKFGDKDSALAKARADELKNQNDLNGELKYELVNRKLDDQLDQQALALQTSALDIQKQHLEAQANLARNSADRLKIADEIIDIEYQQKQLALEAELASKKRNHASDDDIATTQGQLDAIGGAKADDKAKAAHENMGPLAAYLEAVSER